MVLGGLGPIEGVLGLSWLFFKYYQKIICNQEMYTRSFGVIYIIEDYNFVEWSLGMF